MNHQCDVVVIGGGVSGLTTASWLRTAGYSVIVLESESAVGGTMKSVSVDGWLFEAGPNTALETTPLFRTLFSDLQIQEEVEYGKSLSDKRFILRDGMLHPLPMSPLAFFRSGLWSAKGKLRLLKEPFVGRAGKEETVAEFVVRRLGQEFLDYAVNPFVAGVYAGSPEELSVRAAFPKLYALEERYGGLIKGQFKGARERRKRKETAKDRSRLFSFRTGMQALPLAIAARLGDTVRTNVAVRSINVASGQPITVCADDSGTLLVLKARSVVTTIPSYKLAPIVSPMDRHLAVALESVYYPPVAEVFLGYERSQVRHPLDGFGYLIPAKERRSILGTLFSSALFSGRAPKGHVAVTTFIGGSRQPEMAQFDQARLMATVTSELRALLGVNGEPVFSRVISWERAIPQYKIGHLSMVEQIVDFERRHPGLFISGNFRGGIAVSDCVISSDRVATQVSEYLKRCEYKSGSGS